MRSGYVTRRTALAVAGGACASLGGCTSAIGSSTSARLPVLVGLEISSESNRTHEYLLRLQYAADNSTDLETLLRSEGEIQPYEMVDFEDELRKEPGRYVVSISIDGGDWHTRDVTDRLRQEDRICYGQRVFIEGSGESISFLTNLSSACPEP